MSECTNIDMRAHKNATQAFNEYFSEHFLFAGFFHVKMPTGTEVGVFAYRRATITAALSKTPPYSSRISANVL